MLQVIPRSRLFPSKLEETIPQLNQLGGISILIGGCSNHGRLVRPATLVAFGTGKNKSPTHPGKPLAIVRDELSNHEHLFSPCGEYDVVAMNLKVVLSKNKLRRHWRLVPFVDGQRGIWFLIWEIAFDSSQKFSAELDQQADRLPPMNEPRPPIPRWPPTPSVLDDDDSQDFQPTWYPGVL